MICSGNLKVSYHIIQSEGEQDHTCKRTQSKGVTVCTRYARFSDQDTGKHLPHIMSSTIPGLKHTTLLRFRFGCADPAVNNGCQAWFKNKRPRTERFCSMPSYCNCMKDEILLISNVKGILTPGKILHTAGHLILFCMVTWSIPPIVRLTQLLLTLILSQSFFRRQLWCRRNLSGLVVL